MADNSQTRVARRKQKKNVNKPLWKKILLSIGIIMLTIGIGVGVLFAYYISTAPAIDEEKLTDPFSSKVYNMDGGIFADLGDIKRTKIEFDDLPQVLIDAVTATEDVRFFKHPGIDIRRIGGAIKANISRGFGAEGASTITQQVVEDSFLTPDKKLKIKVQEQWLALKLEREYSKEQILEMYLNKIFYGSNAYGVAKAAEIYFGKTDLHDLTLIEAAILAGLPQRPTAYNPYENPDLTEGRVETVLNLMVRHGKISEEQANEARQVDVESLLAGKTDNSPPYQAFLQKVRQEVSEKIDGADIYTDGLKIYTTLDNDIQDHVEFLLTDSEDNPINYGNENVQAATVVLDTESGAIRAIGGGRNRENIDGYNYAIRGGQQPSSTFKPIIAYGPAIEYNKWSTYSQFHDDKPFKAGEHSFNNYDNQFHGWVSMRTGLSQSYNIPALKALDENGTDNAKKFAEGLGITFDKDYIEIGEAIGGTDTVTTPLQLAGAYRAFGNEGIYNEPYAVTKVEFPDGKVIDLKPESEAAMSDYTAYMITDMLKTVLTDGTGRNAHIPGLQVAGKTGTNNVIDEEGSRDSWFNGYTTNYTISVWTGGYDEEGKDRRILPDTQVSLHFFKNLMTEISKDIETADFVKPDSVVEVAVEKGSNPAMLPSKYTPKDNIVTELFVKGHEPGATSEKFDKLDPIRNLKATFDEDSDAIHVKWDYDSDEDVSFEVSSKENDGQMKVLSVIEDTTLDISEVEHGATYEIEVVVISSDGANKSDPKSTKVKVPEEEEEEEENIPGVDNLRSSYKLDEETIDVDWNYNGPPASFEVEVNGEKKTVDSNGIEISGIASGETYLITVTPIGKNGVNKGVRGESSSTKEEIPAREEEENEEEDVSQDESEEEEEIEVENEEPSEE